MAVVGECTATVHVDASRALALIGAMEMMAGLLEGYGHVFTPEQRVQIDAAVEAVEPRNLKVETA